MSTGLECLFVERKEGEWFYILEQGSAPRNCFDWMDYADAYGPFASEEVALKHLENYQANPGGWSIMRKDHFSALPQGRKEKLNSLLEHSVEYRERSKYGIFWA